MYTAYVKKKGFSHRYMYRYTQANWPFRDYRTGGGGHPVESRYRGVALQLWGAANIVYPSLRPLTRQPSYSARHVHRIPRPNPRVLTAARVANAVLPNCTN